MHHHIRFFFFFLVFLAAVSTCAHPALAGECSDITLPNGTTVFLSTLDASNFAFGANELVTFVQNYNGGTSNYPWSFSPCGKFTAATTPSTYMEGAYIGTAPSGDSPLSDIGKDLPFKTMTTAPNMNGDSIQAVYTGVSSGWGNSTWTLTLNMFCYGSDSLAVADSYEVTGSGSAFATTFNAYSKKFCAIPTPPTPGGCADITLSNGTVVYLSQLNSGDFAFAADKLVTFVQNYNGGTSNYPWSFSPCGKFTAATTPSTYMDGAFAGQAPSGDSPLTDMGKDLPFKTMTTAPHMKGDSIQAVYTGQSTGWGNPTWTLTLNMFCYGSDSLAMANSYDVTGSGSAFATTFNAYSKKFCAVGGSTTTTAAPATGNSTGNSTTSGSSSFASSTWFAATCAGVGGLILGVVVSLCIVRMRSKSSSTSSPSYSSAALESLNSYS